MQYRTTLVLLGLLVVLGAFVYFYEVQGPGGQPQADSQQVPVFNLQADTITRLEATQADKSLAIEKQDGGAWQLVKPESFPADSLRVDGVVSTLSSLKASRLVADNATDLAQYGLDHPDFEASLIARDGSRSTLQFGKKAPSGSSYYVKTPEAAKVFLIPSSSGDDLKQMIANPPRQQPTPTPMPSPPPLPTPTATTPATVPPGP